MATNTKERILEKALEMFSTNGFKGTNLRDLAASLGLSKSALYRHYESKDAIFDALIAQQDTYYTENFGSEEHLPPVPTSMEELKSLTYRLISFTIHDEKVRQTRRFLAIEQFRDNRVAVLATRHFLDVQAHIFASLFREMMKSGLLKPNDADLLALVYTSPITSMVHLCDREPEKESQAMETIDRLMDLFIATYGAQETSRIHIL